MFSLRCYALVLFGLCQCIVVTLFAFDVIFNVCAGSSHDVMLNGHTLISCAHICNGLDSCEYFGYNRKTELCYIYGALPDTNDQTCPGNSLISKSSAVHIAGRSCQQERYSHGPNYCQAIADDTMIFGNVNSIGSKRILKCKPGYAIDGIRATRCMESGKWSDHGTCKTICPMFELKNILLAVTQIDVPTSTESLAFDSIDNINTHLFEGTNVYLACMNGTLNGDENVTCVNGSWTQYPTCKGSMRKPCGINSECMDTDSECRNDKCWCKPKLSYDPCSLSCVDVCREYGNTFQIVEGFAVSASNIVIERVTDETACKELCLSRYDYVCIFVDYNFNQKKCQLNKINDGESPVFKTTNSHNLFQRDCASYCP